MWSATSTTSRAKYPSLPAWCARSRGWSAAVDPRLALATIGESEPVRFRRESEPMERSARWAQAAVPPLLAGLLAGCAMVPESRLADCRQRTQALETESSQLKDELFGLRNQNRDLSQRAVDDARRLKDLEEANQRL